MIIMVVLTALTIVSSETATIRPKNPAAGGQGEVLELRIERSIFLTGHGNAAH